MSFLHSVFFKLSQIIACRSVPSRHDMVTAACYMHAAAFYSNRKEFFCLQFSGFVKTFVADTFCRYLFLNAVRPHVSYLPKSITVSVGGSLRIECSSWGYETPSIAWYRDGRRLSDRSPTLTSLPAVKFASVVDDDDLGVRLSLSPNADGQPDGVLRLRDVRVADRATYNCSTTNAYGSTSRTTLLRVRGETSHRPVDC